MDLPAIGCGKSILTGKHDPLDDHRGAQVPLMDRQDHLGMALRTRTKRRPRIRISGPQDRPGYRRQVGPFLLSRLSLAGTYPSRPSGRRRSPDLCDAQRCVSLAADTFVNPFNTATANTGEAQVQELRHKLQETTRRVDQILEHL